MIPAHWIFVDFDNTLMGTEALAVPSLVARFNMLYADKIGREMSLEEFFEHFQGQTRETLCANLSAYFKIHVDYPILFANREGLMMAYMQETTVPMAPNLVEAFTTLHDQGALFSVATNNTIQRCLAAMRFADNGQGETLAGFFGTRYFEAGSIQKPDPDLYLRAIAQTNADIARSCAVEDSATGARAALAAGLKTFGFTGYAEHPQARAQELLNLGVTACFEDWKDFPTMVNQLLIV